MPTVEYGNPRLSSDGTLLAYSREVGTPVASGYDFTTRLWVMNLTTGEQRQIMDGRSAGTAWKPGSHLLSYGTAVDGNYFMTRGEPDSSLANGISAIDLDSGETLELVAPERGYALSSPKWSPDGHFLAFTEVFNMEGVACSRTTTSKVRNMSPGMNRWDASAGPLMGNC